MPELLNHQWLPDLQLDFTGLLSAPLRIASIDLLRNDAGVTVMRMRTDDGQESLYPAQERVVQVVSFIQQVMKPFFEGQDLRELQALITRFHRKHYKIAGLPFWACVGTVEILALDLLGRAANKPVVELLGGLKSRSSFDIYLSSRDRVTTPEQEIQMMQERLVATGARAIKLGIGGRMSVNVDAWPGRSEALITHARKTLGQKIVIYADANGSYDAKTAIEVGAMLRSHQVAMFEEPCPYDDFEMTRQVTHALDGILVSAGESDHSLALFRWVCSNHAVDVVQPDLLWAGGLMRCMQIAHMAHAAGLPIVPHNPRAGIEQAPLLHFLAAIPNPGPFHEFKAIAHVPKWECDYELAPDSKGKLTLPTGAGLGCRIDATSLGHLNAI